MLRIRRGSTLVLVALMTMSFLAVGAIAMDIGRFYVVTGELQTAADAAALVGAKTLQVSDGPTADATVDAAVIAFVRSANRADGKSLDVLPSAVRLAHWGPGATAPEYTYTSRPDAVVVEIGMTAVGELTRFVSSAIGISLTRTAVAWIAYLGATCVRPWALPYSALSLAVSGVGGSSAPDVDPEAFLAFAKRQPEQRMFVFLPDGAPTPMNDGAWNGFNFPAYPGSSAYGDGIAACNGQQLTTTNVNGVAERTQGEYVALTTPAIDRLPFGPVEKQLCVMSAGDAGCYPAGSSTPGVSVSVGWGDRTGNAIDFRFVGDFIVTCYFRTPTDVCPLSKPGYPANGYPEGTIVGYLGKIRSRELKPADALGNAPSNVQRIVLVN